MGRVSETPLLRRCSANLATDIAGEVRCLLCRGQEVDTALDLRRVESSASPLQEPQSRMDPGLFNDASLTSVFCISNDKTGRRSMARKH